MEASTPSLPSIGAPPRAPVETRLPLLMAVDEPYVRGLFVTVSSLLDRLRPAAGLDLHVMAGALAHETRERIERAWGDAVRVSWPRVDERKLAPLRVGRFASSCATYYRLLAASSLPQGLSRVVYLDSDLLVRKDVFDLWHLDVEGNVLLAVQDSYVQSGRHLGRVGPDEASGYFNSGVLVIDLDAWRAARVEERALETAIALRDRARWADQDALNVCLAGRWGRLSPVWNKQFALDLFPDWRSSPYSEREFLEARGDPAIVHFSGPTKPWQAFCDHRPADVLAYRAVLARHRVPIGDADEASLVERVVDLLAGPHRRFLDRAAAAWRARQRSHALRAMLPDLARRALLHPWTVLSVPIAALRQALRWRSA